jgi:hypothetical protein
VLPPLIGRGDKHGQHPRVLAAAGSREGDIVMKAQIRAKPDQMRGHNTPE